ncbi:hypothetical protein E2320_008923, partial [Naja naja]
MSQRDICVHLFAGG